jgi:predicted deacylase
MTSPVLCDVDFDRDGRQDSVLRLPQSHDRSGWGTVEIPIHVVKNGAGPTALFTGGVHGDEFEGQIAVSRLARELEPEGIRGRVIMIPAVDMPAALASTRLCPVDGKDLNRCFPGTPKGTFSDKLAHFIDSVILPMVDVSVDVHSGGTGMDTALSTNMHFLADAGQMARTLAAAEAFGAPYNCVFWSVDEGSTLPSACEARGILSLGTELGGRGGVNVEGVRIAERGLRNILKHMDMMEGAPDTAQRSGAARGQHMMVPGGSHFIFAPANGIFEPTGMVGDAVEAGSVAGWIHFVDELRRAPIELRYPASGRLWAVQSPGRPRKGDCIVVVMEPYQERPGSA